jgi:hypothetical protein
VDNYVEKLNHFFCICLKKMLNFIIPFKTIKIKNEDCLTSSYSLLLMRRIIITTNDVMFLTGKSESYSQKLIKSIKDAHDKKKHQPITIRVFCDYMDLPFEEVFNTVNGIKDQSA